MDFDSILLGESQPKSPNLSPGSPFYVLFILLHKTSSFNAVVITMATRGRPITMCIILVIISCFHSYMVIVLMRTAVLTVLIYYARNPATM